MRILRCDGCGEDFEPDGRRPWKKVSASAVVRLFQDVQAELQMEALVRLSRPEDGVDKLNVDLCGACEDLAAEKVVAFLRAGSSRAEQAPYSDTALATLECRMDSLLEASPGGGSALERSLVEHAKLTSRRLR